MSTLPSTMEAIALHLALRVTHYQQLINKLHQYDENAADQVLIFITTEIEPVAAEIKILCQHIIDNPVPGDLPLGLTSIDQIPGISQNYQDKLFGIFKLAKQSTFTTFCQTLSENNISITI